MSVPAEILAEPRAAPPRVASLKTVSAALVLLIGGGVLLAPRFGWRQALLYLIGAALGVVLYHARFGSPGAWRSLIVEGRGAGLRAQLAMFALATVLFLPALDHGSLFGRESVGVVAQAVGG
ncbi:MAG TPA: hypothetical protein VGQ90_12445 [Stellaceae bacterium]|nr:hypothetical protein [Stellaceae bacterium]